MFWGTITFAKAHQSHHFFLSCFFLLALVGVFHVDQELTDVKEEKEPKPEFVSLKHLGTPLWSLKFSAYKQTPKKAAEFRARHDSRIVASKM